MKLYKNNEKPVKKKKEKEQRITRPNTGLNKDYH